MFDASVEFLRLIAMGLGLHENYFDSMNIPKTLSTLRLINYPVHNFEIPSDAYGEDGRLLSTAQHRDTGILTLLCTFDYEGLEVHICLLARACTHTHTPHTHTHTHTHVCITNVHAYHTQCHYTHILTFARSHAHALSHTHTHTHTPTDVM